MTGREAFRRLVHIGVGGLAFLLPVLGWKVMLAGCGVAVVVNGWVLPQLPVTRNLLRAERGGGRRGLVLYPLAVGALVLGFRDDTAPIQAGWLALALGDGLAPFFGVFWSRPRWPWCAQKVVPASAAAFAVAGVVMTLVMPVTLALAGSVGGMLGETVPGGVDDNVTVPLLASVAAFAAGLGVS